MNQEKHLASLLRFESCRILDSRNIAYNREICRKFDP